jgi:hypothetical protein
MFRKVQIVLLSVVEASKYLLSNIVVVRSSHNTPFIGMILNQDCYSRRMKHLFLCKEIIGCLQWNVLILSYSQEIRTRDMA